MKVVAVIPCLNEEKHIAGVVKGALKHVDIVLVSDGGSIDSTVQLAKQAGAVVYIGETSKKHGYGANLSEGIKYALRHLKPDVIVILDGDGQHDTCEIPLLLTPIFKSQADVVMGSRYNQNGMPTYRMIGNRLLSFVCNAGWNFKNPDSVIGFWAIKAKCIPKLTEKQWGICIELFIKARKRHMLVSVPVKPIYHEDYKDNSTLPPVSLAVRLLWAIIKWRIKERC